MLLCVCFQTTGRSRLLDQSAVHLLFAVMFVSRDPLRKDILRLSDLFHSVCDRRPPPPLPAEYAYAYRIVRLLSLKPYPTNNY